VTSIKAIFVIEIVNNIFYKKHFKSLKIDSLNLLQLNLIKAINFEIQQLIQEIKF